jgi:hypothetical protein
MLTDISSSSESKVISRVKEPVLGRQKILQTPHNHGRNNLTKNIKLYDVQLTNLKQYTRAKNK